MNNQKMKNRGRSVMHIVYPENLVYPGGYTFLPQTDTQNKKP